MSHISNLKSHILLLLLFSSSLTVFAQFHPHQIDSVMDISPAYLPTSYAHLTTFEFEPLIFQPIDTGMVTTHLYDPLFKSDIIYQNLGIGGQAHQSMIFNYKKTPGFLYQTLPYPLYFKEQNDLVFYKVQTTYSRVAYAMSFPKDHELSAVFAKTMKGVSIAVNMYASVNKGTFTHQDTRNLCGDFLLHYEIPSSIFGFRASYIINFLNNAENGGLSNINTYQDNAEDSNSKYGVITPYADSKITTHDIAFQPYVNIKNKKKKYFGTFTYDFLLKQTTLRYHDEFDSITYAKYSPHYSEKITNDSTRVIALKNALQWSNFEPYKELSAKNYFFHIAGGVLHDYTELKYSKTVFNSFDVFARTHIRMFKILDIKAKVSYSFYGFTLNDLSANAEVSFAINREKEHLVGASINFYNNSPEYMMQHLRSNNFRWDTLFLKQNILHINAFWNFKKYNFTINYYFLNKYVYLSEELRPAQSAKDGNLLQFSTFIPFFYKNFGATANLNVQYCTKEVVHVPIFAGKLSLFYIIELFKKRLKIQVGTDLMYNTAYYADAYLPVLHKFYYQSAQKTGNFLYMDVNLTLRIDRINFFFRAGNLLAPAMVYRNFTTPYFPVKDYLLSIGINWRFFD